MRSDVHQHLWPIEFIEALRRRKSSPQMEGWTLKLDGEPDFEVAAIDHDVDRRSSLMTTDNIDRVLISLSSPLGVEHLPYDESRELLDAFHDGALALPPNFGVWASVNMAEPNPSDVMRLLDAGCVGLQVPTTAMLDPHAAESLLPLFEVLSDADKPLFVHPGAASGVDGASVPAWWSPIVPYVSQMHAAWYAFRAAVEPALPELRSCFALLGGLAPLHDERCASRGGPTNERNSRLFVDTSSYGSRSITATADVLGEHAIVYGSDRPYALPPEVDGDFRDRMTVDNVAALLGERAYKAD